MGSGEWGLKCGVPAETGLTKTKGSFVSSSAVGSKVFEGVNQSHVVAVGFGFGGDVELNRSSEACDRALFACLDFAGLKGVTSDDDVFGYPLFEVGFVDFKGGKAIPTAEVALEENVGHGEGKMIAVMAETGGSEKGEAEGFRWARSRGVPKLVVGGGRIVDAEGVDR